MVKIFAISPLRANYIVIHVTGLLSSLRPYYLERKEEGIGVGV